MFETRPLYVDPEQPPVLFCVVDTEEEFDWSAPLSRQNTGVRAAKHIHRVHEVLSRRGVKPTYVVDYAIASQPDGRDPFREMFDSGDCAIGAHLHPWVTPPHTEDVNGRNSFACNLDPALEREKIRILREEIAEQFGQRPVVYKAGRYGLGRASVQSLDALGFTVDTSINPRMDFTSEGGPSFRGMNPRPSVFASTAGLVEIPCTTGYTGVQTAMIQEVRDRFDRPDLRWTRVPGILARLGLCNKVMLTPEGHELNELIALTRALWRRGLRTFSLTFHSPSAKPGCTPYVRTSAELDRFLGVLGGYLDFFFGDLMGTTTTVETFAAQMSGQGECAAAGAA